MKDQAPMMNQPQPQMMSMPQQLPPVMSQQMSQQNSQMYVNVNPLMNPSQMMPNLNLNHRGGGAYGMWPPQQQVDQVQFQNLQTLQNPNLKTSGVPKPIVPRNNKSNKNWKGKKGNDKWSNNNNNRKELVGSSSISSNTGVVNTLTGHSNSNSHSNSLNSGAYNPPTLHELQQQNRLKARRYFPKKKFNHGGRHAPYAPRNTTSFLIRAKKSGGITSLVSPCPVTPAVLPTPIFSPSREVLVDMAKEEWGVDGYGSMKGLIRLRSPGNNEADGGDEDEEDEGGSSESDVEEHVEVERRLDHDLSRFEMIYPNYNAADHSSYLLENRVDDQDTHIAQLEEENLILKERLFLMEREFDDLRMRLQCLERQSRGERVNEEVVENDSENESESRGYGRSMEDNNEVMEEAHEHSEGIVNNNHNHNQNNNADVEVKQSDSVEKGVNTDVLMEENVQKVEENESKKEYNDGKVEETESKKENEDGKIEETESKTENEDGKIEETESKKENDVNRIKEAEGVNEEGQGSAKNEESAANV